MISACCLKPNEQTLCSCSAEELLEVIGKKWVVVILNLIHAYGPLGYNAIFNKISGITPKAFGDKLRLLAGRGLIAKHVAEKPLRTTYHLTPEGRAILERLRPFLAAQRNFAKI